MWLIYPERDIVHSFISRDIVDLFISRDIVDLFLSRVDLIDNNDLVDLLKV